MQETERLGGRSTNMMICTIDTMIRHGQHRGKEGSDPRFPWLGITIGDRDMLLVHDRRVLLHTYALYLLCFNLPFGNES